VRINDYTADEIKNLEINYVPIIDKLLYQGDTMLWKAQSKTGKSVGSQQIGFALSCGQDLLDTFSITREYKVAYISGEGFIGNWKDRFINMEKMWRLKNENFYFFECSSAGLHKDDDCHKLMEKLAARSDHYDVFIFDPIYALSHGANLNSQEDVGMIMNNIEMIKKHYHATAIIVHHDSEKVMVDQKGGKHSASHSTAMGSSFIMASCTHSYTISKVGWTKGRTMHKFQLGRERGGWAIKEFDVFMITPEEDDDGRLGYTLDYEDTNVNYHTIKAYIEEHEKVSDSKPFETIGLPSATFYRNVKKLENQRLVEKTRDEKGKGWYVWLGHSVEELGNEGT